MKFNARKIISLLTFAVLFSFGVQGVDYVYYHFSSFDRFVEYSEIKRSDVCYGEKYQELEVVRKVKTNLPATISSELFLVRNDTGLRASDVDIKLHQEKFDIVYEANKEKEIVAVELPILEKGEYYWIELATLKLPHGIQKRKALAPQYFSVIECDHDK